MLQESKRVSDMNKDDLKMFIKDILEDELDKDKNRALSKEDVKNIVREMLKKHYRLLWSNSSFYIDKI